MEWAIITAVAFLAGVIGTVTGFGTATVMTPVLLLFLPFYTTLLLVGIIHWFGNVWKILLFKEGVDWRMIVLFGVPGVLAAAGGAYLMFFSSPEFLSRILGVVIVCYSLIFILRPRLTFRPTGRVAITGGVISGFFSGIFGIGGMVYAATLAAFNLPKAVYLATLGAIGVGIDSVRVGAYVLGGIEVPDTLMWGLIFFIPASFLGAYVGKLIVERIPQERFRLVVLFFLFVVGILLISVP